MAKDLSARQQFEKQLKTLVEKFHERRDEYVFGAYSEAQARLDFIDPLFQALGWDVSNQAGLSYTERAVIVEQGETTGKPDYNFRINGRTVFFVEAKAPRVSLETSRVIHQAKKYAYNETSQIVMLAAVTDFEEFRLYEVRDISYLRHAHKGLIFAYRYDEYLTPKALDDLWKLAHESVAAGSLDTLVTAATRRERQRVSLDQQFLSDLTDWRERLAKAVFKQQPDLDAPELNSVVQVFLDRLIFIRVAEDRGVLPEGQLNEIAQHWRQSEQPKPMIAELFPLFRTVNRTLNGEIFKPHPCEEMKWDSALLADIVLEGLDPYNFAQIGVELLGSIYERYLGKTIRVTETRAVVEDKPQVRKAGGVYYTPKYIVDYIVAQTVGKLIQGKTPAQIAKLKILDPACGSGSFLIGAYQKLLDYHVAYYAQRSSRRGGGGGLSHQARLLQEPRAEYGEFKLSLAEKADILRNNIFGVDIDPQAVEITMMSLYIKMLEGERGAITGQGVLPRLRDNIKCGNSLIGYDIGDLSDEDKARINPFDWQSQSEGFGEILANGGFDAVIGNPPYVRPHNIPDETKKLLWERFKTFVAKSDMYACFMERGLTLTRPSGLFSFIVPQTWTSLESFTKIREFIIHNAYVRNLAQLPKKVFAGATVETCIFVLEKAQKGTREKNQVVVERLDPSGETNSVRDFSQKDIEDAYLCNFQLYGRTESQEILEKVKQRGQPLSENVSFLYGFKTGDDEKFIHTTKKFRESKPFIRSAAIKRFVYDAPEEYVWYVPEQMTRNRTTARPGDAARFEAEKIMVSRMGKSLVAAYDSGGLYVKDAMLLIGNNNIHSLKYMLGVINSRLLTYFYQEFFVTIDVLKNALLSLPIRAINFADPADKSRHDKMVALVEKMLDLHKQTQATKSNVARERIEREINVTDEQIDTLVYELYGLTKEEIKIVEGK